MVKFITQHRRGTTKDWENSNIVPQDGEIVLEELSDKTFRVKIGDGVKSFNELPYADASVVSAIQQNDLRIDGIVAAQGMDLNTVQTEVVDMRTIDDVQFSCAGDAVRKVNSDLKILSNSLSDFKDAEAVDGLAYEGNILYLVNAEGEKVGNGVEIIGGGGGGGTGSSYSTLVVTYVTPSKYIISTSETDPSIKFKFYGTDSSNDSIAEATATWRVDGVVVKYGTVYGNNPDDTSDFNTFYLKELIDTNKIKVGTNKLQLQVRDDSGALVTKNWTIQLVDIRVEFDPYFSGIFTAGEVGWINYIPYGAVDKKIIFKLHNGEDVEQYSSNVSASFSGVPLSLKVNEHTHGSYLLEVYAEATIEGSESAITSDSIFKDLVWFDSNSDTPIIAVAMQNIKMLESEVVNIEFDVYDPTTDSPSIDIYDNDNYLKTVNLSNSNHALFDYQASSSGAHELKIKCKETIKIIHVQVDAINIDIPEELNTLAFDFNPVGKSNDDIDRLWKYNNDISMEVSSNFDWINGGYKIDDEGSKYFCIKAGTTATIKSTNYKLFGDDAKATGKEFKIIFKTTNVSNSDACFLTCIDQGTSSRPLPPVGINMFVHQANIYAGNNLPLNIAYSEDDIIEFEININRQDEAVPMVMGYEDGVSTRAIVYKTSDTFTQSTKKDIVIGSEHCDVHIYRMKAYKQSLSSQQILDNFVRDARTSEEKQSRYLRNKIYDENGNLTPESLASACPWLRVYKVEAPHFTYDKDNKVTGTTISQIYKDGDPILDNWTCYNAMHSGQGTSSNDYGAAGRNLDFIMNDSGVTGKTPEFILGDNETTASTITLTRTSVPVAYLNAKVNIASSNNLTNALLARRYNDFNPYKRPFNRSEDTDTSFIKDTMEFYNCAIFIRETDLTVDAQGNYVNHTEFNDTSWHFYAIGNIGDSKKTDKTRLTDPSDPYECCVEILDVALPLSTFPADTMYNVMSEYTTVEATGERIYKWVKNENRPILYEKDNNGKYFLTDQTADVDFSKTYYVDILENDKFDKSYTYDWRYISNKKNSDIVSYCKDKWIEFYRFVTQSSDEDFKRQLKDYFVVESALFYYLFTTRYCMVDNRAKNTFWHYSISGKFDEAGNQEFDENGKPVVDCDAQGNPIRRWDLCWDYDNDTSLGLNNFGQQVYRYGFEDFDTDEKGTEVFRASASTFFCRIRDLFSDELEAMYKTLESDTRGPWSAAMFLSQCDEWQSQFPEELWRIDIERKYIRTYTTSFINGPSDSQFLENMCNGRMKYQRRQWERLQELYMQSKYKTPAAKNSSAEIRATDPEASVISPNYALTLTSDAYMYLNVQYGETKPISRRVSPGQATTLEYNGKADIIQIYNAPLIRDFGNISLTYPETASISNAKKLTSFVLGNSNPQYVNNDFTSLTTGANTLLRYLDVQNIKGKGLQGTLDLSQMISLEELKAKGTLLTSVTFAEGGKIERVELPETLTNMVFKNLSYLSNSNIIMENDNYSNISTLECVNCPNIDSFELFKKCERISNATITGLNISSITYAEFDDLFNYLLSADLSGNVTFEELTGTQYDSLVKKYPKLNINFKKLVCNVTFITENNDSYVQSVTTHNNEFGSITDPSSIGNIKTPEKTADETYTYTYAGGWSTNPSSDNVEEGILNEIKNDLILYPVFNKTAKQYRVEFYNGATKIHTEYLGYNGSSSYLNTPTKLDTKHPDMFTFKGWKPKPEHITGNMICYAQYELDTTSVPEINLDYAACSIRNNKLIIESYSSENPQASTIFRIPTVGIYNSQNYDGVIIESGAFRDCDLEYVELSEGITEIGIQAFARNAKMTQICIPKSVTKIGDSCFTGCSISKVAYNAASCAIQISGKDCLGPFSAVTSDFDLTIGTTVESIPNNMFKGQHCKSIHFATPSIVSYIGDYAFTQSKIVEFTCPTSVKTIGKSAFRDCQYINNFNADGGYLETIDSDAFNGCTRLINVSIQNGYLTKIGSGAFAKTSKEISFLLGAASIFKWKSCFNEVNGSDIDDGGFLIDTKQGKLLLGTCSQLTEEDYSGYTVSQFDSYAFFGAPLTTLFIPKTVTFVGSHAFDSCTTLSDITFEEGSTLNKLDDMTFYKCSNLSTINLPESVSYIGSYCFAQTDMTIFNIPDNVSGLGTNVFNNCSKLETVSFKRDSSVYLGTVDSNTYPVLFEGCNALTEVICGNWIDAYKNAIPMGANSNVVFKYTNGDNVITEEV